MKNDNTHSQTTAQKSSLPVCPFEGNHPDMLITMPEHDKRLDVYSQSEYSENTQSSD